MSKRKIVLLVAIVLMLGVVMSACGGTPETPPSEPAAAETKAADATAAPPAGETKTEAPPAAAEGGLSGVNEFPISKDKIELTAFCAPSALIESMDANEFTKWYEEKTNVHITWDAVPAQARLERLNMLLASNDIPDIIFGANVKRDDEMVYGPSGLFADLSPYIEKHGYYIKEMFNAVPYIKSGMTAADGKIYSLPQVNECFHCMYSGSRIWIDHKIRDELGLKNPTTTDELYTYLKALKDKGYMGIVGHKPDPNQFNRAVVYLMNSFTYLDVNNEHDGLQVVDGKVTAAFTRPEFKEGLKYAAKLYKEGLIEPTTFTQTADELKQTIEDPNGNKVGVGSAYWFGSLASLEGDRHKEYDILEPVKGPEGVQYSAYSPYNYSTGQFVVSANCKNIDAAVKWADFLFSDEAAVRYIECGREDKEWRQPKEGEVDFYDRPAKRTRINDVAYSETTNVHYYQMGPSFRSFEYRESWDRGGDDMYSKDGYEYRLHIYTTGMTKYRPDMEKMRVYPPVYTTEADSKELLRITSNIKDHRTQYIDAFVTGQKDIDAEWDAYVKGFEAVELPLFLEIKQRAYDSASFKDSVPSPGNPNSPLDFSAHQ